MTNGEKIQSMFPNMNFGTLAQDDVIVNRGYSNNDEPQVFIPQSVWNAEYKEPTTKNNLGVDCIDRAELLKAMDTWDKFGYTETGAFVAMRGHYGDYPYTPYVNYNDMVSCVKNMPSVTPQEPKTGHWNDMPKYKDIAWQCSECGHFTTMKHNYCPKCGAKMDLEDN